MRRLSDNEIAPSLGNGPLAKRAKALTDETRALGSSASAGFLRVLCVPYLFDASEKAFATDTDPVAAVNAAFAELTAFIRRAAQSNIHRLGAATNGHASGDQAARIEEITGEHYGRLFEAFSPKAYWEEPLSLLRQRLERNGISASAVEGKRVLDAGCGGGRYSAAWRQIGAGSVVGLDMSPIGIRDAQRRAVEGGIEGVDFQQGNVLEIPFADRSFDVVFSNGVLHHTRDWKTGISELVRVLKTGGMGWLYVIEDPGGLYWDIIEILRVVLQDEPRDRARAALSMLGIPANRIFYMLDHVMVPINLRLQSSEVAGALAAAGATDIRRLARGADFDRVERIHQGEPLADVKYGVGENRFVFSRA